MEPYGRSPAAEETQPDPSTALEESMWQLGLGGGEGPPSYPEKPGEPDCAYYIRTGSCGYGDSCRFNHPRDRRAVVSSQNVRAVEYPERVGQPVCQFFLKTGTCKYGNSCKYDHPRQGGGSVRPVTLNIHGFPLRPGEKECSYYMRTGQCKFGSTCKFHHPEISGVSMPSPAPAFYSTVQPPAVPASHQYSTTRPSIPPVPYMQGPYGPMLFSPGVIPVPSWSPYPLDASTVVSPGGQRVQAGPFYGSSTQLSPSAPAYPGPYLPVVSSGPSSSSQEHMFPERPDQPECRYYMRTGDCKYGSSCKYHHPADRNMPKLNYMVSPTGLPLRPGTPICPYYAQHGGCNFGPACKYDHPVGAPSYSPSTSSLVDMAGVPYPIGFSIPTLAPSSSFLELRPELISDKDSVLIGVASSESMPSSSVGPMFSERGLVPHSVAQFSCQTYTPASSSAIGHNGDASSSS